MIPRTFIFFNGETKTAQSSSLFPSTGRTDDAEEGEWSGEGDEEGSYLPSSTLLLSWPLLSLFPFSSGVPRATEEGVGGGGSHLTCASVNLGHGGGFTKTAPVDFWLSKVALLDSGASPTTTLFLPSQPHSHSLHVKPSLRPPLELTQGISSNGGGGGHFPGQTLAASGGVCTLAALASCALFLLHSGFSSALHTKAPQSQSLISGEEEKAPSSSSATNP